MKIGFYKVGLPVYFKQEDHRSWSVECRNLLKVISELGEVYLMSENDYEGPTYYQWEGQTLDRVYVMNGPGEIPMFACQDVRLFITDLALVPSDPSRYSHIYSQSKLIGEYACLEQNALLSEIGTSQSKVINFYFGGTERKRTKDFFEYVWRPGHLWHGKSDSLGLRDDVPFDEHRDLLAKTRFTIVIGDEEYNKQGFVTPRYYECLLQDVLPFVDLKFDEERLIPIPEELRVSSYIEMYNKMNMTEIERVILLEQAKKMLPKTPLENILHKIK